MAFDGPVAQLDLEQGTSNSQVGGSSPPGFAKSHLQFKGDFLCRFVNTVKKSLRKKRLLIIQGGAT